jgi:hypothetical protein
MSSKQPLLQSGSRFALNPALDAPLPDNAAQAPKNWREPHCLFAMMFSRLTPSVRRFSILPLMVYFRQQPLNVVRITKHKHSPPGKYEPSPIVPLYLLSFSSNSENIHTSFEFFERFSQFVHMSAIANFD